MPRSKDDALARNQLLNELAEVIKRHYELPFPVRINAARAALDVADANRKVGER